MYCSYTKPKGQLPDYTSPIVLQQGRQTVEDFCNRLHKSIIKEFKQYVTVYTCYTTHAHVDKTVCISAIVWGSSVKHNPQKVGKEHFLNDEDVVQIVKK